MSFPVANHVPVIDVRDVHYAVLENSRYTRFPVGRSIHIDRGDFDVLDNSPDFWPRAEAALQELYERRLRPELTSKHAPTHLTIAAFAPIPMLMKLGALIGDNPRDMSWTVLGVEFGPGTRQLWYPENCKQIAVQLAMNAVEDNALACCQLAHECVHLLAPNGRNGAPVLEEGLATVFSEDYVDKNFRRTGMTNLQSYVDAATKVRQLLALNPDAIKTLRKVEPCFKTMTASTFVEAGLSAVPENLVNDLLSSFCRTS